MVARLIFWSFVCLLITTIAATLGGIAALLRPNSAPLPLESYFYPKNLSTQDFSNYQLSRPVNILVMGIDPGILEPKPGQQNAADIFSGRSDTMILARFDPIDSSINLLWIPRDTRVQIPNHGLDKINQANAIGGAALASRVVSLNFNYVPIDRYVRISPTALSELVDLLGGLEIFVPKSMSYTDITGKLTINLAPGWQTLTGDRAMQFARFRNDELGDIGRIQRQQMLLRSLTQRLANPASIEDLPKLILGGQKYIDTNLTSTEIMTLIYFIKQLDRRHIKMVLLPGDFSNQKNSDTSYWVVNSTTRQQMIQQYFEPDSGQAIAHNSSSKKLKIAIQNATNNPKNSEDLAKYLTQYLTQQGFRTVYQIEPWPIAQQETQIIAEKGNIEAAQTLQELLKFGKIEASSVGEINSDITIRVGRDVHRQFFMEQEP